MVLRVVVQVPCEYSARVPALRMRHAYPHDVPQYLPVWPHLHLCHRTFVADVDLMSVRGLERRAHRYLDLGFADLFSLVEQSLERGMHLLDGWS